MNWDTHCLTGIMPTPARHFKTPIFIVWTTPRQKDEQISLLPNCSFWMMIFSNRLAITNSMPTGFIWRQICHPAHLQPTGQWNISSFYRNSCIHTVMYSPRLRLPRRSKLKNTSYYLIWHIDQPEPVEHSEYVSYAPNIVQSFRATYQFSFYIPQSKQYRTPRQALATFSTIDPQYFDVSI